MGFRFHKSIKIAPGLKLNLNKKSVSVTAGTKGAHYTISSSGKKTASVGIPGTGLSYTTSSGGKNGRSKKKKSSSGSSFLPAAVTIIGIAVLIFVVFSFIRSVIPVRTSPADAKLTSETVTSEAASQAATPETADSSAVTEDSSPGNYILNTSSHKIHKPTCKMADSIAPENYDTSNLSLEELKNQGYTTCGNCF